MEKTSYVIWGFGGKNEPDPSVISATERLHRFLTEAGLWDQVLFCVDSNPLRQGTNMFEKETYSPEKLKDYPQATVIVNVQAQKAIIKAAEQMKIENPLLFTSCYYYHNYISGTYPAGTNEGRDFYQYMKDVENDVKNIYDTSDQITADKLNVLYQVANKGHDDLFPAEFYGDTATAHSYFCDNLLAPKGDVTLVDIGAYIGDSIEPVRQFFGKNLKKCYAFEPNAKSRESLEKYLEEKNLKNITNIYPYAVGAEEGILHFTENGTGSAVEESGETEIPIKRFEDIYEGHEGSLMIKMDIEGQEMNALRGMENIIKKHKPYLAICVYHKLGDILEIPQYLQSLNPDYKFYLRGGWHLECWAVPKQD